MKITTIILLVTATAAAAAPGSASFAQTLKYDGAGNTLNGLTYGSTLDSDGAPGAVLGTGRSIGIDARPHGNVGPQYSGNALPDEVNGAAGLGR